MTSAMFSGIGCPNVSGSFRFMTPAKNVIKPKTVNCIFGMKSPSIRMKGATMPPTLAATETMPTAEFRIMVGKISALMEEWEKELHY